MKHWKIFFLLLFLPFCSYGQADTAQVVDASQMTFPYPMATYNHSPQPGNSLDTVVWVINFPEPATGTIWYFEDFLTVPDGSGAYGYTCDNTFVPLLKAFWAGGDSCHCMSPVPCNGGSLQQCVKGRFEISNLPGGEVSIDALDTLANGLCSEGYGCGNTTLSFQDVKVLVLYGISNPYNDTQWGKRITGMEYSLSPSATTNLDTLLCPGGSFAGEIWEAPGSFSEVYNSWTGCDSLVTWSIALREPPVANIVIEEGCETVLVTAHPAGDEPLDVVHEENEGKHTFQIIDARGCTTDTTLFVQPSFDNLDVYRPNTFSPNDDGLNDWFQPEFDPETIGDLEVTMLIFNRWGDQVFEKTTSGLTLLDRWGWDGEFKEIVNPDVYVYWFTVTNVKTRCSHFFEGGITLMR